MVFKGQWIWEDGQQNRFYKLVRSPSESSLWSFKLWIIIEVGWVISQVNEWGRPFSFISVDKTHVILLASILRERFYSRLLAVAKNGV